MRLPIITAERPLTYPCHMLISSYNTLTPLCPSVHNICQPSRSSHHPTLTFLILPAIFACLDLPCLHLSSKAQRIKHVPCLYLTLYPEVKKRQSKLLQNYLDCEAPWYILAVSYFLRRFLLWRSYLLPLPMIMIVMTARRRPWGRPRRYTFPCP